MKELQVFNFEGHEVRTVIKDGEPWFALNDVCGVLEIANTRNVTSRLDLDEKGVHSMDTPGGLQNMTIINEYGLYNVILLSRKPEAKAFRHWITHNVLPSIRKHGAYATDDFLADPRKWAATLTALAEERDEKARIAADKAELEGKNQILQITASKYEGQTKTVGLYKIGEIAEEFGVSAAKLNKFLFDSKVQYKPNGSGTWRLFTEHMGQNYAFARIVKLDNGYEKPVLLWTAKGRDFIFDLVEQKLPDWYA